MLADSVNIVPQSGRLDPDIHLPSTAKLEIVDFIVEELPRWRDHPDRPTAQAETILTEHLCDHLNSAAYYSTTWSHIQFRTETGNETRGGRKIDLTVKPRAATLIIKGRRHSQFDALFPIECKRLPTPKGTKRDEREYVITKFGTTGGIQRFKFGHHGAAHTFAAMIAYVQKQSFSHWLDQVNGWIRDLAAGQNLIWNNSDILQSLSDNLKTGISTLESEHQREGDLEGCELRHLWIRMS
ncbi:MAG: hypothetical protein U9N58_04040 [Thermodesulfobacteriota bacterium]|nr:hypothetical protein [Thermodesulfobacteriota bacterium]